jgi:hypothetical protein
MARRDRAGQVRIIEAALAAIIMLAALTTVNQFIRNPRLIMASRSGPLRSIAYNALYRLDDTGVLDNTLGKGEVNWESDIKIVLATLLPSTVYYNLTVYAFPDPANPSAYVAYNRLQISNSANSTFAFTNTPEVSTATYLYVTGALKIYLLRMQIAEGGVEA